MSIGIKQTTIAPASYKRISLKDFSSVTVDLGFGHGKATVNNPVAAFIRADGTLTVQGGWWTNGYGRETKTTITADQGKGNIVAFYDRNGKQTDIHDVPSVDDLLNFLDDLLNGWNA
jgi:hypothetical protein